MGKKRLFYWVSTLSTLSTPKSNTGSDCTENLRHVATTSMIITLVGDALLNLRELESESVDCCVTSPPYWNLRDYGVVGQLGAEETPQQYIQALVEVFREVRRVLKNTGTLWLNLGDSYNGSGPTGGKSAIQGSNPARHKKFKTHDVTLKPKDLMGLPWRTAIALQTDGWYLRSDIIWHKPNPMPENIKDRPAKSHEYVFLLSKQRKYFYDLKAISEPAIYAGTVVKKSKNTAKNAQKGRYGATALGFTQHDTIVGDRRNKRTVWDITLTKYKGSHFATFPRKLVEPCLLAGCPVGGVVIDPFSGAGTVGVEAEAQGKNSVLIELNPEYVKLQHNRFTKAGLCFSQGM